MAFTQLKMKAIGNPSLAPYIAEFEPLYGVNAKMPMSLSTKMGIGAVTAMILLGVFIGIMVSGESKDKKAEEQRLTLAVTKVQSLIAAGQYETAQAACSDVAWTELRLDESKEMEKIYNQKREELLALIKAAQSRKP